MVFQNINILISNLIAGFFRLFRQEYCHHFDIGEKTETHSSYCSLSQILKQLQISIVKNKKNKIHG